MEGALPRSRGARGLPNLPRFACADLRCAPPSALLRVGDTPPHCALLPPPSPGGVRHVHAAFQRGSAKAKADKGAKAMKKTDTKNRPSIYQTVTDRILSSLKAGVIPWEKPWKSPRYAGGPFPRNFYTGKPYRGINVLLLWSSEYNSPFWLTFKQVQA